MNQKSIEKTELNKILALVAEFAVLEGGKALVETALPVSDLPTVRKRLQQTQEARKLLFEYGVSKIEYFSPFSDELDRAEKGSTLSCGELLKAGNLLRTTRIAHTSIRSIRDEQISILADLADRLYFDAALEEDIGQKILNDTDVSDHASEKLYTLRREIRLLNERIRSRLSEYLTGKEGKYLQDAIVTMRDNRYVLPVRAEYKRNVKGFIHDRSSSGATFFIEPEEVLEMNNELRSLAIDEKEEVERILSELSHRVGAISDVLRTDISLLHEIDASYARAEYGYKTHAVFPDLNENGVVEIEQGRHPLIDRKKVVPVSLALGKTYRFLLISGPNTGGKTVTLKMVGLFCMMAMSGLFVPAKRANISVFDEIYCDVGDAQSIEDSLSTFSSHITNIIEIVNGANARSLILIDELGGGTDPDEGQALAKAIVSHLLRCGSAGVVTTHYTALKEFAFFVQGIENACMEFDANTLQPLYAIRIGLPGASNALAISRRLGLKESILEEALGNLSQDAQRFENIVRTAEESRIQAENTLRECTNLQREWQEKLAALQTEREKLQREKDKLFAQAKSESRRIVNERVAEAEEFLEEIEQIFAKQELTAADLIQARTLKNKIADKAYETESDEGEIAEYADVKENELHSGMHVFVKHLSQEGIVQNVRAQKKEAEVLCGNMRVRCKLSDLAVCTCTQKEKPSVKTQKWQKKGANSSVEVKKSLTPRRAPALELNVIGRTVQEAIPEVEAFIDAAVIANLEEVRIVHGVGTGKLRAGVQDFLRKHKNVAEFRLGKYGEGETGVTIVKIK